MLRRHLGASLAKRERRCAQPTSGAPSASKASSHLPRTSRPSSPTRAQSHCRREGTAQVRPQPACTAHTPPGPQPPQLPQAWWEGAGGIPVVLADVPHSGRCGCSSMTLLPGPAGAPGLISGVLASDKRRLWPSPNPTPARWSLCPRPFTPPRSHCCPHFAGKDREAQRE